MKTLPRRTFLRGTGVAIALPFLDCMIPSRAFAQTSPKYLATFYVPYGAYMGADFSAKTKAQDRTTFFNAFNNKWPENFSAWSEWSKLKNDIVTFGRVDNTASDHRGDHHNQNFLGYQLGQSTIGNAIDPSKSVTETVVPAVNSFDQTYAESVANQTKIRNINMGVPKEWQLYESPLCNPSWRLGKPQEKIRTPQELFVRLFGSGTPAATSMAAQQPSEALRTQLMRKASILDLAKEDINRLKRKISSSDRHLLDQHFESIRSIEMDISKSLTPTAEALCAPPAKPGVPQTALQHWREMCRLLEIAFACDLSRVASYLFFEGEKSGIYEHRFGIPGFQTINYHDLGHGNLPGITKENRRALLETAEREMAKVFIEFAEGLRARKNAMGQTLLSQSMLIFGSSMSIAEFHHRQGLPLVIAGQAGGALKTGRRIDYGATGMAHARVQLALLQKLGVNINRFNSHGTSPAPQI